MRVFVYFNLHKKMFSVKALSGPDKGRVIHYSDQVLLQNACARVQRAGRLKVVETGVKNVHAGIVGELVSLDPSVFTGRQIKYNPKENDSFVYADDVVSYEGSEKAYLVCYQEDRRRARVFVN